MLDEVWGLSVGRRFGPVVLTILLFGVLTAPAAIGESPAPGDETVRDQRPLAWHRCAEDKPETFECATVRVPLDYARPGGKRIDIAISRIRATDLGARRGVLLMNPGGPGSPGLNMPVSKQLPKEVAEQYDLIGFDPRGVGASTPVTCGLGEGNGWAPIQFDVTKFDEHVAKTKEIANKCWAAQPDLLPYITTRNTARDMDVIRLALNEQRISYYGVSYGTYLGVVYTQMFPRKSDRIVLDSNVDPERTWRGMVQLWAIAAERAFDLFAGWAAKRDETYGLGASAPEVRDTFRGLLNELDRRPVTVDGQSYDGNRVRLSARGLGQHEETNESLAELLRKLLAAQGRAATTMVPSSPSSPMGWPRQLPSDNRNAASLGVMCGDARWPTEVGQYWRDAIRDTQRYPMMGGQTSNIAPCAFWPEPREPRTEIRDNQAGSVLLVQSSHDVQTPVEGAVNLRRLLSGNSRMALIEGSWRHGAYPGNCADDTVTRYLLHGELPAQDVTCPSTQP